MTGDVVVHPAPTHGLFEPGAQDHVSSANRRLTNAGLPEPEMPALDVGNGDAPDAETPDAISRDLPYATALIAASRLGPRPIVQLDPRHEADSSDKL